MNAAYTSRGPHNVADVTEPLGHFTRDDGTDRTRRAMEAAGAVDAKNAPTAPWKTAQHAVSHSYHRHSHRDSGTRVSHMFPVNFVTYVPGCTDVAQPRRRK